MSVKCSGIECFKIGKKTFELVYRLAETIAWEEFPVAVANLTDTEIAKMDDLYVDTVDFWKAKPESFFLSGAFRAELHKLLEKYKLILLAAPPVVEPVAVALVKSVRMVYVVRFGKDNDEDMQAATGHLNNYPDAMLGAVITEYRPNVEYIWEG